jgi:hypothetical protein
MNSRSQPPIVRVETKAERTRVAASLDTWATRDWSNGIHVWELEEFQRLHVCTRNTLYELIVVDRRGDVRVRGGRYFPDWTAVRFAGSTAGGCFLKQLGIIIGLRMEFAVGLRRIVTSPVRAIAILQSSLPT